MAGSTKEGAPSPALGGGRARRLDAIGEIADTRRCGNWRRVAMSRKTGVVLALGDYRARQRTVYFTRAELNQLLGLYSLHVIRGVWRDYAIDHGPGLARFSVFRHTHEAAAYTILKTAPSAARPGEFIVQSGRQRLRASRNLSEALEFFRSRLSLVAAGPA
jgi:hypothetical protein